MRQIPGTIITSLVDDNTGLCVYGIADNATAASLITTAGIFAPGARIIDRSTATTFKNTGTTAAPVWNDEDQISTGEIADSAISAAKARGTAQSVTGTDDGLTTGLITTPTSLVTFVAVTSAAGTKAVTLPAASTALIGSVIYLTVGANGYELLTPASSNNTINQVDADGTNQLDVAADTTVRATCISATGWICETIAATSIAITAPDND